MAASGAEEISRPKEVCKRMFALMESGLMSDVEFQVASGERVKGHKCVFAVASPYFRTILESGEQETDEDGVVKLADVDAAVFKKVVEFLYTGWISLTNSDAATILPLAAKWEMLGLRSACEETMIKHLSVETVCESMASAHECGGEALRERCLYFICKHGTAVLSDPGFTLLPRECVRMVIESNDLAVGTELEVFKAVVRWGNAAKPRVEADAAKAAAKAAEEAAASAGEGEAPTPDLAAASEAAAAAAKAALESSMQDFLRDLMPHVRFPTMSPDVIEDEVEPLDVVDNTLVLEAFRQHARPAERRRADAASNPRLMPRKGAARRIVDPSKGRVHAYVGDFDTNGVLYYIGTQGGTKEWANPAETGRIVVTRSGGEGTGRAIDAAGRTGTKCFTDGTPGAWWAFDLGPGRSVMPARYTLRHGSKTSTNLIRNWAFEGSADGHMWVTLREHTNDETLKGTNFATASWKVEPSSLGDQAFRHLRIRQTGPTSTGDDYLVISGFEVYGTLFSEAES